MKLFIDDTTSSAKPLYYQSLILLFLPCEKFGEGDNDNSLYVKAWQQDGTNFVDVRLEVGDRVSEKSCRQSIDTSVYSQMKNLIGRTILVAAFELFGTVPPWGISTGVKPVKLARMFVKAFGKDEALRILRDEYMIHPGKAQMAVDACIFEDGVMENMGVNPCSLYISIPFCPTKCNYCSFVSCTTPRLLSLIPQYVLALKDELSRIAETIKDLGLNLKSVYVGGGTPAILSAGEIDLLLSHVCDKFDTEGCEFTFEAGRPDCITYDKLKVLSDYGVPRISINTQTTNDEILKGIGRNHTYADFVRAFETARKFDFKCINTDLIAGLPGESPKSFLKSVRDVVSLSPENITVHAFTLKRSSNYRIGGEKSYSLTDAEAIEMTDCATKHLTDGGFLPYYVYRQKNTVGNLENVGYSKKGFESIYNIIMMGEYHTVFGAGAGSVTKIVTDNANKVDRIFSPKYPYEFLDKEKYAGFDARRVCELLKER
ncbi:MAG: coproporphyrinogen dehydrogenase HemZ [Clostridia bacterium]|nr:coproporphyrinogen dehydrogenase HemZ [Clostridia bacterium]